EGVAALRVLGAIRFLEHLLHLLEQGHGDDRFVMSLVALALPKEFARVNRVPEDSMDFRFRQTPRYPRMRQANLPGEAGHFLQRRVSIRVRSNSRAINGPRTGWRAAAACSIHR